MAIRELKSDLAQKAMDALQRSASIASLVVPFVSKEKRREGVGNL
jgi:hypothetical protein